MWAILLALCTGITDGGWASCLLYSGRGGFGLVRAFGFSFGGAVFRLGYSGLQGLSTDTWGIWGFLGVRGLGVLVGVLGGGSGRRAWPVEKAAAGAARIHRARGL